LFPAKLMHERDETHRVGRDATRQQTIDRSGAAGANAN
jgi:hypothetical protein